MKNEFKTAHEVIQFSVSFTQFSKNLETILGRVSADDLATIKDGVPALQRRLDGLSKGEELIIFQTFDHGALMASIGQQGEAKQYLIGNPLTALSMTKHNRGAGLYAPLRVLVSANKTAGTQVEYDLPSSLFAQFDSAEISKVARGLDAKLLNVLSRAGTAA